MGEKGAYLVTIMGRNSFSHTVFTLKRWINGTSSKSDFFFQWEREYIGRKYLKCLKPTQGINIGKPKEFTKIDKKKPDNQKTQRKVEKWYEQRPLGWGSILWWGLVSLQKEEIGMKTQAQRKGHVETERGRPSASPGERSRKKPTLPESRPGTFSLQNCEKYNFVV